MEWIQAGLRNYGVSVHIPPVDDDYEPLLALLGNRSTNATEKIPWFVRYNAFRWLRDSGFQAIPFAMSNISAQTLHLVRDGVFEYGKLSERGLSPMKLASWSSLRPHWKRESHCAELSSEPGCNSVPTV